MRSKKTLKTTRGKSKNSSFSLKKAKNNKGKSQRIKSIKRKLSVSLLGTCLIPLIIVGIVTFITSRQLLKSSLTDTTKQTLDAANIGLTNYFDTIGKEITFISNTDFKGDESVKSDTINNLLTEMVKADETISKTYFQFDSGELITTQNDNSKSDIDVKRQNWYSLSKSSPDKYIVSSPHSSSSGKTVITLSKAMIIDGKFLGVVALDLDTNLLTDEIAETKFGEEGYLIIVDNTGVIMSDPDKAKIGYNIENHYPIWNDIMTTNNGIATYNNGTNKESIIFQTNELTGWKLMAKVSNVELINQTRILCLVFLIMALVIAVIAFIISKIISRNISGNVVKIESLVTKASDGNFKDRVYLNSKDELNHLADSFNIMADNLSSLMSNVDESCEKVYSSSTSLSNMATDTTAAVNQVAIAIDEIAQGASNQALNSSECTSLLQDLSDKLEGVLKASVDMGNISNKTKNLSSDGVDMLTKLMDKSQSTLKSTTNAGAIVEEVNKSILQIGKISDAITEITSQTNLLSLNASIEAARAGEYGRGFAVVADEIRKLAEASNNSAEEIKKIVKTITEKSNIAVKAMKDTESIVESQTEAANSTEKVFNNIMKEVLVLADKINNIKSSIHEINEFKDNVLNQVENVAAVSEETASTTEEVSASTQEITAAVEEFSRCASNLNDLANNIKKELDKFEI